MYAEVRVLDGERIDRLVRGRPVALQVVTDPDPFAITKISQALTLRRPAMGIEASRPGHALEPQALKTKKGVIFHVVRMPMQPFHEHLLRPVGERAGAHPFHVGPRVLNHAPVLVATGLVLECRWV